MTTHIVTVELNTPVAMVISTMSAERVSCLLVVQGTAPIGIVTERDIVVLAEALLDNNRSFTLAQLQNSGLVTLAVDSSIEQAYETMNARDARHLILTNPDGSCAGLITRSRFLKAQFNHIEAQKQQLEQRVEERTQELRALNSKLLQLTNTDPLTGIRNRRAMSAMMQAIASGESEQRPALALLDIDHFKKLNDCYGHLHGDAVLRQVATTITHHLQGSETVYRYGGEEFLLMLSADNYTEALERAENIRVAIEHLAIENQHAPAKILTCSIGVACINRQTPQPERTIADADSALYRAKSQGRNRIERADADNKLHQLAPLKASLKL